MEKVVYLHPADKGKVLIPYKYKVLKPEKLRRLFAMAADK